MLWVVAVATAGVGLAAAAIVGGGATTVGEVGAGGGTGVGNTVVGAGGAGAAHAWTNSATPPRLMPIDVLRNARLSCIAFRPLLLLITIHDTVRSSCGRGRLRLRAMAESRFVARPVAWRTPDSHRQSSHLPMPQHGEMGQRPRSASGCNTEQIRSVVGRGAKAPFHNPLPSPTGTPCESAHAPDSANLTPPS